MRRTIVEDIGNLHAEVRRQELDTVEYGQAVDHLYAAITCIQRGMDREELEYERDMGDEI